MLSLRTCLAVLTVATVACGGDDGGGYLPPAPGVDASGTDSNLLPTDAPPSDGQTDPDGGGGNPTDAPVITILSPVAGTLVSGQVALKVRVEDPDGITAVTATINNTAITMTKQGTTDEWHGTMNTVPLAGLVAPQVNVRAADSTGQMAQVGISIILDNEPPIASLDSPNVRMTKMADGEKLCSAGFDPLGTDAPNDGDAVAQLIELRARVRDLPNSGTMSSAVYIPRGGTDSVELFVFDDTTKPLVVDTNGDGTCDAINPTIVPKTTPMAGNEAAALRLAPVSPRGAAVYTADTFGGSNASVCNVGTDMAGGTPLCLGETGATIVIATPFTTQTEIFGIPPAEGGNCLGFAFDARASNISEGWACAAVRVTDKLGNSSVSAPLRICIDTNGDNSNGCADWGDTSANAPNCTGTVTAGTVNNTACTPHDFTRSTTPNELELIAE